MSQGNYSHTTRAAGTILTANIYNSDHVNHITNLNPQGTGGYSDGATQMRQAVDPGLTGGESLATSLAGELERIRFAIRRMASAPSPPASLNWYDIPFLFRTEKLTQAAYNALSPKLDNTIYIIVG